MNSVPQSGLTSMTAGVGDVSEDRLALVAYEGHPDPSGGPSPR
jgi:hypothetical protein